MKKIIFALSAAVVMASCGGNEGATDTGGIPGQDTAKAAGCVYSYDSSATEIGFGAFKFTEKKEVKGSFLKFMVDSTKESENPFEVINGAVFKIDVEGLSTQDIGRDNNVKTGLFMAMDSTSFITGKVGVAVTTEENAKSQIAFVKMKMNNVEKECELKLELTGDELKLTGTINLDDFNAQKALMSLNKACHDFHKGPDGVSKTWNEVNIYVSTKLKNSCK